MMSEKKSLSAEEKELNERLKYEIAEELGLLNKVSASGWKSLTAKESGRIGGILTKRKKDYHSPEETKG